MTTKTWEEIATEIQNLKQQGRFRHLERTIINPVTIIESNEIGPKTTQEWTEYEKNLLHRIVRVIEGREKPRWEDLFLRDESDFISGKWTAHSENWQTLIAQMPGKTRALVYHTVIYGADLFYNLKEIPRSEPVKVKNRFVCTRKKKHEGNTQMLADMNSKQLFYTNERLRCSKHVPRPYEVIDNGNRIRTLKVPNQDSVRERADDITKQVLDWCKMGSISLWNQDSKPWLTAGFILVDREDKETRVCWNGSILKPFEKFTFPCKLEGITTAIQMVRKGDLLYKFDDRKGNYPV